MIFTYDDVASTLSALMDIVNSWRNTIPLGMGSLQKGIKVR
jgi:hypothetical protein